MKILALNSSLRAGIESKTELLLNALVSGMRAGNAIVETVNLKDVRINYCLGCYACMTATPGTCIQKDDMTATLFPKWCASDLVVYASPLFHHTVNALMKTFIERTFPAVEPFLVMKNGVTGHPIRQALPKAVVLSVCGFPEISEFYALSHYAKALFKERLVAEIYRPGAEMLDAVKTKRDEVLEAVYKAGLHIAENKPLSPEILETVAKPLTKGNDAFNAVANLFWKTLIREKKLPRSFNRENRVPRPESIDEYLLLLETGFNPAKAAGMNITVQFDFTGSALGSCHIIISREKLTTRIGKAEKPDLHISSPFETWMDVTTRTADGAELFLNKAYTVSGDVDLLIDFSSLFK